MSYPMRSLHLREDDIDDKPNIPPLAGPEIDDLDPTDSGIDDGLLPPGRPDGRRGRRPPSHTPLFPGSGVDYPAEPGLGPVRFAFFLVDASPQKTYTIVHSGRLGRCI